MKKFIYAFLAFCFPLIGFAQEVVVREKTIADHIMDVIAMIPLDGALVIVIAGAVDLALRLVKSEKPLGVMYLIVDVLKALEKGLEKLAQFLDKILPQRLK